MNIPSLTEYTLNTNLYRKVKSMNIKVRQLLTSVLGTIGIGALSGLLSMGAMSDYAGFVKPPLAPPAWLFPIAWSILYLLMGISLYIIRTKEGVSDGDRQRAVVIYLWQLAVNFIWPLIFFNLGAYFAAFLWLLLLIVLVILMIRRFYGISKAAAWLNVPYLLWLLFAGYLNFAVWMLNR